jgi:uncharacterized membrane protein YgcG
MKQKVFWVSVFIGFLIALPSSIFAVNQYRVVNGPKDFYYGHISYVELKADGRDPQVLREGGEAPEIASLNLPLGPGDTIRTSDVRRCEIQFDNGTIIRLDVDTELKIETIMAQSLSSAKKLSNLVLRRGQIYVMYKQYDSREIFQVLTPNAALKLKHNTVAMINMKDDGSTDLNVKYGRAYVLYGPNEKRLKEKIIYKDERFTVRQDNTFVFGAYTATTDFEAWNKVINDDFLELHKGKTTLPKPIQDLPAAVFYFAQKYANIYGEWIYDDYFGYVWRPFMYHYYPWGSWQPYVLGRWTNYNDQMYWVPEEPWGWIPYHLGVWHWDNKYGWVWLPGRMFAPAWVGWAFYGGYFCWRPWTMWDWMWWPYNNYGYSYNYYQDYWGSFGGSGGWGPQTPKQISKETLTKISKDQLQKPSKPSKPPFSMPVEFKKVVKALQAALDKGDENARASLQAVSRQAVVVRAEDLTASRIQGRAKKLEPFLKAIEALPSEAPQKMILKAPFMSHQWSSVLAVRAYEGYRRVAEFQNRVDPSSGQNGVSRAPLAPSRVLPSIIRSFIPQPPMRSRDWNPDLRAALKIGVDIQYSSRSNEVYCPQLGLSSGMIRAGGGTTNFLSASGGYSGSSSSSGGDHSGGSSASSGSSAGGSTSSAVGSGSTSSGSSSGHHKN